MTAESTACRKQIDELLSLPQQMWLLGAGISKDSGIPLMFPLTDRVADMLKGEETTDFQAIRENLPDNAHVEHVLSHLGDLMAIASRSRQDTTTLGKVTRSLDGFEELHSAIQHAIRDTVRWGFFPEGDDNEERIGTSDSPLVTIDNHRAFVTALYRHRRAGLERRPPVQFFTTNYDTLLEDALTLCRIHSSDGFSGGAMAFWDPSQPGFTNDRLSSSTQSVQAKIYKLHGSIDWFVSDEDIVVRRREGAAYPADTTGRLVIYPQATKYQVTQKDPFASLFAAFRTALTASEPGVLAICGCSFGDEHITEEIERALKQRANRLTVLIFCSQPSEDPLPSDQGLPDVLARWLSDDTQAWRERIIVAGSRGVYHGTLENMCPSSASEPHTWWSFEGVTRLLKEGPEIEG